MRKSIKATNIAEEKTYIKGFGKLCKIDEKGCGLSKILLHMKADPFVIATAFRTGYIIDENRISNDQLVKEFRCKGLGGLKLTGYFIEDKEGEALKKSSEESFFLSLNKSKATVNVKGLEKFGSEICKKYDQHSVIFSDGESIYFLSAEGKKSVIEKNKSLNSAKLIEFFSKWRGEKFVFEGWADPSSFNDAVRKYMEGIYGYFEGVGFKVAEKK